MTLSHSNGTNLSEGLHQVGSRYAVRDYLRKILNVNDQIEPKDPRLWHEFARRMTKGRLPKDAWSQIEQAVRSDIQSANILSVEGESGKALGKPMVKLQVLRGLPERVTFVEGDRIRYDEDWLLAQRETIEIKQDRVEVEISPYGVGFTRHMLERVYERENVGTGELDQAMTHRIRDLYGQIAYNLAKRLVVPLAQTPNLMKYCMMVPFGDGLAIIERREVMEYDEGRADVTRATIRNGRILTKLSNQHEINVERAVIEGKKILCRSLWIATTFLSKEILRPEQSRYIELHRSLAKPEEIWFAGRIMWDVSGRIANMTKNYKQMGKDFKFKNDVASDLKNDIASDNPDPRLAEWEEIRALLDRNLKTEPSTGKWVWSVNKPMNR